MFHNFYSGDFGAPSIYGPTVYGSLFVMAATMGQEIANYYACARIAQVPPPPLHAVNRGTLVTGVSQSLIGLFGVPISCQSLTSTIGAIAVTQVSHSKQDHSTYRKYTKILFT